MDLRWKAASILGKTNTCETMATEGDEAERLVQVLINTLERDLESKEEIDWWIKPWRTLKALGKLGIAAAPCAPLLASLLNDNVVDIRCAAIQALGKIGAAASPHLDVIAKTLEKDEAPTVRRGAVEVLGGLGTAATPYVSVLATAVRKDKVSAIKQRAAEVLGNLGGAAAPHVDVLFGAIECSRATDVRRTAAKALCKLGAAASPYTRVLATALENDVDISVRRYAAKVLCELGAAASPYTRVLATALENDVDSSVRRYAAKALGMLGTAATPYVHVLANSLENDAETDVRSEAIQALRNLDDAVCVQPTENNVIGAYDVGGDITSQNVHAFAFRNRHMMLRHAFMADGGLARLKYSASLTPAHFAAMGGATETIRDLIEREGALAICNMKDIGGSLPLHYATRYGHVEASLALIEGSDTRFERNDAGFTAIDLAREGGFLDLSNRLSYTNDLDSLRRMTTNKKEPAQQTQEPAQETQDTQDTGKFTSNRRRERTHKTARVRAKSVYRLLALPSPNKMQRRKKRWIRERERDWDTPPREHLLAFGLKVATPSPDTRTLVSVASISRKKTVDRTVRSFHLPKPDSPTVTAISPVTPPVHRIPDLSNCKSSFRKSLQIFKERINDSDRRKHEKSVRANFHRNSDPRHARPRHARTRSWIHHGTETKKQLSGTRYGRLLLTLTSRKHIKGTATDSIRPESPAPWK